MKHYFSEYRLIALEGPGGTEQLPNNETSPEQADLLRRKEYADLAERMEFAYYVAEKIIEENGGPVDDLNEESMLAHLQLLALAEREKNMPSDALVAKLTSTVPNLEKIIAPELKRMRMEYRMATAFYARITNHLEHDFKAELYSRRNLGIDSIVRQGKILKAIADNVHVFTQDVDGKIQYRLEIVEGKARHALRNIGDLEDDALGDLILGFPLSNIIDEVEQDANGDLIVTERGFATLLSHVRFDADHEEDRALYEKLLLGYDVEPFESPDDDQIQVRDAYNRMARENNLPTISDTDRMYYLQGEYTYALDPEGEMYRWKTNSTDVMVFSPYEAARRTKGKQSNWSKEHTWVKASELQVRKMRLNSIPDDGKYHPAATVFAGEAGAEYMRLPDGPPDEGRYQIRVDGRTRKEGPNDLKLDIR